MKLNLGEVIENTISNGGYSSNAKQRYMVALEGFEEIISLEELKAEVLEKYVNKIKLKSNESLGTWIDEGLVYLDKSIAIDDIGEALRVARENKQLAIYDIVENVSIYL